MKSLLQITILSGLLLLASGPFQKAEALNVTDVTLGGVKASATWGPGIFGQGVHDSSLATSLNDGAFFGGSYEFEYLGKAEKTSTLYNFSHFDISFILSYTRNSAQENKGDFTLTWSGNPLPVTMDLVFLLKASTDYSLYFFNDFNLTKTPLSASGTYNVGFAANQNGKYPELSHLSVFGRLEPTQPVPEPATLLLFGTGILGIAGFARKKKR